MHVVTIIHYQSVTELGLVFHNSYSNFTNFPSIFLPLLNVSVSANKIEVCAKISIIDIRRFFKLFYLSQRHLILKITQTLYINVGFSFTNKKPVKKTGFPL